MEEGTIDFEGKRAKEGWYYWWWRGLHLLCGREGLMAGLYPVRPSHEGFLALGLVWRASHRAILQRAPGEEDLALGKEEILALKEE